MNQTSHTPGEWVMDEPSNWLGTAARVSVRKPYGLIATVEISGWKPKRMAIANAHLIAAAPDLLAACEAVAATCGPADDWNGETRAFLKLIEAAIAKAKGVSP